MTISVIRGLEPFHQVFREQRLEGRYGVVLLRSRVLVVEGDGDQDTL